MNVRISTVDYGYCDPANLCGLVNHFRAMAGNRKTLVLPIGADYTMDRDRLAVIGIARRLRDYYVILNYCRRMKS